MILQIVRRSVQVSVVVLTAMLAVLSLYAHYRSARVIDDAQLMQGMRGEVVTKAIHPAIEMLDDPQSFLDGNKGTVWSMRLMGIELSDPLAAAEMMAASKSVHWPLLMSIIIPVLLTALLGKVFCSWICPGYLLFELTGKLRKLLRFAEIEPGEVRFSFANKYIFLLVGLGVAAVFSAPLFALVYPPAVISRAFHAWIFGTELVGMLVLLGVMVGFELFVSPRWWCRTMCPGGALYGLIGWARPLRVKLKDAGCTGCGDCIPVCEAGINPITRSSSIECDNCGVCIRHCGDGVLYFSIGLPERAETRSKRKRLLGIRVAACVVAMMSPMICASPALAHHILGLPHYSYKENYPQRPTLEYPATSGPYEILLTSYPGTPIPGEPANLAFYIKNGRTNRVYAEPITVRILKTATFGDNTVLMGPAQYAMFDNEHKLQFTFPDDGEYAVELSVMIEGRIEVIPFLMIVGNPTATTSIVLAATVAFAFTFVALRAIQVKRKRRMAAAGGADS